MCRRHKHNMPEAMVPLMISKPEESDMPEDYWASTRATVAQELLDNLRGWDTAEVRVPQLETATAPARQPVIQANHEHIGEQYLRRLSMLAVEVPGLTYDPPLHGLAPLKYVDLPNAVNLLRHAVAEAFTAGAVYAMSLQPPKAVLPTGPCCDMHNHHCEPPYELCCKQCTEAAHDTFPIPHADGSACVLRTPTEERRA